MLYSLTDLQVRSIADQLSTLTARTIGLTAKYPNESIISRIHVDGQQLLSEFLSCTIEAVAPDSDGIVDIVTELQGRLPKGSALTIQIPPMRSVL